MYTELTSIISQYVLTYLHSHSLLLFINNLTVNMTLLCMMHNNKVVCDQDQYKIDNFKYSWLIVDK